MTTLILFDIDDTILKAKDIHIIKRNKITNDETRLKPSEFSKEDPAKNDYIYDYREFADPVISTKSIINAEPILPTLNILIDYHQKGCQIGFLTAREMETVIFKAVSIFLKTYIDFDIRRDLFFAINDKDIKYKQKYNLKFDYEVKAKIISELSKDYKEIVFLDDDHKNIKYVEDLKLENVTAILVQ